MTIAAARRVWRSQRGPVPARALLAIVAPLLASHACGQDTLDADRVVPTSLQPVAGQLRNAQAIAPFLAKLPLVASSTPPLKILQIGDSHTAGDMFTNGWRNRWQAEYGSGGRGMTAVGKPYQGFLTWGVTARQSPDWSTNALFGKAHVANGPALGLSGFTMSTQHAGAWLQLSADEPRFLFNQFTLCGLTGPDKGAVRITMGSMTPVTSPNSPPSPLHQAAPGNSDEYSFAATEPGATCFNLAEPAMAGTVLITTLDDRPVNLTSWASARQAGGVILANLGVVGARLAHFNRNDDKVLELELRQAQPDLMVVAFGTNEGFDPSLRLDEAEAVMRTQIGRIRNLLGYPVPILLIGPPDAASNRVQVALPGINDTVNCGQGWYVPGNLARTRQLQLRLAQDMNLAFWDWQGAMGGPCSSSAWVAQGLQRADHVHFTAQGGRLLGEALASDLDQARSSLAL